MGDVVSDALDELSFVVSQMGPDEVRVMVVLARRLLEGQRAYGRLDLATDRRDFRAERAAEIADMLMYSAFAELQASDKAAAAPQRMSQPAPLAPQASGPNAPHPEMKEGI